MATDPQTSSSQNFDATNPTQSSSPSASSQKQLFALLAVIVLIGGVSGFAWMNRGQDSSGVGSSTSSGATSEEVIQRPSTLGGDPQSGEGTQDSQQSAEYQNGTYQVRGAYRSPAGPEEIDVTLTLTNGEVTQAEVVSLATNPGSQRYQSQFVGGFQEQVLGKNIDEIQLDVVAGSSLTPKGFQDALEKIKQQALNG